VEPFEAWRRDRWRLRRVERARAPPTANALHDAQPGTRYSLPDLSRFRPRRRCSSLWLLSVLLAGCTVDEIDFGGKACPCADGYVCDVASNVCVKPGSGAGGTAGAVSGGGGGPSGGSGGVAGTGGTPSGGSGGIAGSGGIPSGGSGGSPSGGSGGTPSGGSGGTPSGGSGGTPSGGSGGAGGTASTQGIQCSGVACDAATQDCCWDNSIASGVCVAKGTCANSTISCDDAQDCAGAFCCARFKSGGGLNSALCVATAGECTPAANGSVELWCDAAAGAGCPTTKSCTGTSVLTGYQTCL